MTAIHPVQSVAGGTQAPSVQGFPVGGSSLLRFPPEPRNSLSSWAGSALSTVGGAVSSLSGAVTGFGDVSDITNLLNQQIYVQQIMQTVSMASNIARSQHETEMAPIRNMRVG